MEEITNFTQEDIIIKSDEDSVKANDSEVSNVTEFKIKSEPVELLKIESEISVTEHSSEESDMESNREIKIESCESLYSFEEPFLKNETDMLMNNNVTEEHVQLSAEHGYIVPDKLGEHEFGDKSALKDDFLLMTDNTSRSKRKRVSQPVTEDEQEQIRPVLLTKAQPTESDISEQKLERRLEESQPRNKRKQVLKPLKDPEEEEDPDIDCQPLQKGNSYEKKAKEYPCEECGAIFVLHKSFQIHKRHHKLQKQLKCAICQTYFQTLDDLSDHSFSHSFDCVVCKKSFSNVGSLTRHIIRHPGMRPYKCSFCKIRFTSLNNCKTHERDDHETAGNNYTCFTCKKDLHSLDNLRLHTCTKTHNRPYKCCYCASSFISFKSLSLHTRNSHSNAKEHTCQECGKKFGMAYLYIHHMYNTKGKCDICKEELTPACALVRHLKSHKKSHVLSYSCKVCKCSFFNRNVAHKHVTVHHPAELEYVKYSKHLINYDTAN